MDLPGLIVASGDFGYGAAGKLESITSELRQYRLVLVGSPHTPRLAGLRRFEAHYPNLTRGLIDKIASRHGVRAALVVLDPSIAKACLEAGVSTVYVDSLPFLWTDHDDVPAEATVYCAQMCPFIPRLAWSRLQRIKRLKWVDGIVPVSPGRMKTLRRVDALINLGGLAVHWYRAGETPYAEIVVESALRALSQSNVKAVRITGNLDPARLRGLAAQFEGIDIDVSNVSHSEFRELMASTGVVLTAPGLTALTEAAALGKPTILLPPQNISQYLNAEAVVYCSVSPDVVVSWPGQEAGRAELEHFRGKGRFAAPRYAKEALDGYLAKDGIVDWLCEHIMRALEAAGGRPTMDSYADTIGRNGASQVAETIDHVLS